MQDALEELAKDRRAPPPHPPDDAALPCLPVEGAIPTKDLSHGHL